MFGIVLTLSGHKFQFYQRKNIFVSKTLYNKGNNIYLKTFVDVDCVGDRKFIRSTSGYILKIGNFTMSWCGKSQSTVAPSSFEVEYRALMEGTKKIVWLRKLLSEIKHLKPRSTIVFCDNISSTKMAKSLVFHAITQHIKCHHHVMGEKVCGNRHTTHPKYSTTSQHSYEAIRHNKI